MFFIIIVEKTKLVKIINRVYDRAIGSYYGTGIKDKDTSIQNASPSCGYLEAGGNKVCPLMGTQCINVENCNTAQNILSAHRFRGNSLDHEKRA